MKKTIPITIGVLLLFVLLFITVRGYRSYHQKKEYRTHHPPKSIRYENPTIVIAP